MLYLMSLPYEPNLVSFTVGVDYHNVSIIHTRCFPQLFITWKGYLRLIINDTFKDIALENTIIVPLRLRGTLKQILSHPSHGMAILFHYYDEHNYVQIPDRDQVRDVIQAPVWRLLPIDRTLPKEYFHTPSTHFSHDISSSRYVDTDPQPEHISNISDIIKPIQYDSRLVSPTSSTSVAHISPETHRENVTFHRSDSDEGQDPQKQISLGLHTPPAIPRHQYHD